jgi:hypothetical protein
MSIYAKLNSARAAFHAMPLKKSGKNSFAGYSYFELGDFLIPALKVFETYGLCPVISFDTEIATLRIVDAETKDEIVFTSPMAEANLKGTHPIQNLGAVQTYQRRYLYMAALEIVEHDAIDASAPVQAVSDAKITKDQVKALQEVIEKTKYDVRYVCEKKGVKSLSELSLAQYKELMNVLQKKEG